MNHLLNRLNTGSRARISHQFAIFFEVDLLGTPIISVRTAGHVVSDGDGGCEVGVTKNREEATEVHLVVPRESQPLGPLSGLKARIKYILYNSYII